MYNIKVYDTKGKFLTTLAESIVSCGYSYSATVEGGFSSLNFDYYGDFEIQHRNRIKVFKKGKAIYQGFVVGIQIFEDEKGKRKTISCNGNIGLLSFLYATNGQKSADPMFLIKEVFDGTDFNTNGVKNYGTNISLKVENKTRLQYLKDILKTTKNFYFFIDAENNVFFDEYGKIKHQLTYGKDVFSIQVKENSSQYFNLIELYYGNGTVIKKNLEEIEKYGISYKKISDTDISNETTANLRAETELAESGIKKNCKIEVNKEYNIESIKPGDIISVRNTNRVIENKKVKQIQYNKDTASITLDSYESLEKFILKNNKNV